jgi:predicted ATPase/class 3 adenylate cyclase
MRADLPSGTVTFLFTDVESSTKLLYELGTESYAEALATHRQIVREVCTEQRGVEVDTQGDAFFFAFPGAAGALRAADAIVDGLASGPIRLRVGLHTGTSLVTEEGYVGPDVVRAARIAASGHGGQVLLSSETEAVVRSRASEPAPVLLRDLGEHRFKDLAGAERVFQLGVQDFPPLRSLHRTNLPVPSTSFLGRERELAEVMELARRAEVRLLTLTGPGGTGKTRLAMQAAAEVSESFPDGLWWVGLATLGDPRLFATSLAQVLAVPEEPERKLTESLGERLQGKQALLLIDNAEHLLPAIASEIAWLRDVEGPTILVTSRERLQLQGEHVYAVPSLENSDGVDLFVDRARALGSAVGSSGSVAELCERLDNLPLALELAAARTVVFSPEQLLDRLSQRLDLLRGGHDADPRQQTLRATIEWSYDLLDPAERRLFRAVSVFAGCDYEAAEAVCGADPDRLQSLLDKSLLRRSEGERPRYWMLATILEFAAEQLRLEREDSGVRRRHAEHFIGVALSANLAHDAEGRTRHDLVIPERDNLRSVLAWALQFDERELGLELVVALENYWATTSPEEAAEWVAKLLDGDPAVPRRLVSRALRVQGGMENVLGHLDLAEQRWEQALAIARSIGDDLGVAILLHRFAATAAVRGDWPRVRQLAEESLAGHRRIGFPKGEANALTSLAEVAHAKGDDERALVLLEESRRICETIGFSWWLAGVLARIGALSLDLGRLEDARANTMQALSVSNAMRDRSAIVYELSLLSEIDLRMGNLSRAGTLQGGVEAEREKARVVRWLHETARAEPSLSDADGDFARGRALGRELSLEESVALALDGKAAG